MTSLHSVSNAHFRHWLDMQRGVKDTSRACALTGLNCLPPHSAGMCNVRMAAIRGAARTFTYTPPFWAHARRSGQE